MVKLDCDKKRGYENKVIKEGLCCTLLRKEVWGKKKTGTRVMLN